MVGSWGASQSQRIRRATNCMPTGTIDLGDILAEIPPLPRTRMNQGLPRRMLFPESRIVRLAIVDRFRQWLEGKRDQTLRRDPERVIEVFPQRLFGGPWSAF